MTDEWETPPINVLLSLASLLVHLEEGLSTQGKKIDEYAVKGIIKNPMLMEWLDSIPDVLLPVKR